MMMDDERVWQRLQLSQAAQALAILGRAGVPCMLLKGAAGLAAGWFRPGERRLTDIDVLLPPAQLSEAVALLVEHGWPSVFRTPSAPDARRHSQAMCSPWGFLLDLHWFALRHARWAGVDDILWQGAAPALLDGVEVLVPSAEDFLVHTIAHGVRRGSSGALWRQDVRTLLAGRAVNLNWARVIKTSANYRVSPLVARALEAVAEELPSKIPKGVCEDLRKLPLRWGDRVFLQLTTDRMDEAGFLQAVVLVLDYLRTRPTPWLDMPCGFIDFLRDRWELRSRASVLGKIGAVAAWGLQSEARRARARFLNWNGKNRVRV